MKYRCNEGQIKSVFTIGISIWQLRIENKCDWKNRWFLRARIASESASISPFFRAPLTSISLHISSTIVSIHIRLVAKIGRQNSYQNPCNLI